MCRPQSAQDRRARKRLLNAPNRCLRQQPCSPPRPAALPEHLLTRIVASNSDGSSRLELMGLQTIHVSGPWRADNFGGCASVNCGNFSWHSAPCVIPTDQKVGGSSPPGRTSSLSFGPLLMQVDGHNARQSGFRTLVPARVRAVCQECTDEVCL